MENSSSETYTLLIAMVTITFGLTGYGLYTAFGPPSKELEDPFEEHED
ncbi:MULTISPECIES: photosystem II reaction center protein PsbN [unclassified Prochlorococcus]|nr:MULTISPECIES: photosystem II reaction center protein PsbN [unclassified Prochlorococcus]KZR61630.1 Protein PsbN [Prochlorococcus sp. MIT 1306]KZR62371.1 Protein PsbN [Prochlorococcus sp. MIT 1303]MEC9028773.1 photosystem II reaction center protein PsbN [Cyanobacteriota bacterium]